MEALHGRGTRQAAAVRDYGNHRGGLLAGVSSATVQRLPGTEAGRLVARRARARGSDSGRYRNAAYEVDRIAEMSNCSRTFSLTMAPPVLRRWL